jgi:AcrR family transcriptional regulator
MTTEAKDERIKQQIREAARELFQKWGLLKTTMEDIAKAARKGKSTLYYYFKNKDEIFEEIVYEELNSIISSARTAMETQTSAEGRLRAYWLCTLAEVRQRRTLYDAVFGENSNLETTIATLRKKLDEHELVIISKVLADGVRSGELRLLNEQDIIRLSHILLLTYRTIMFEYALKNAFDEGSELIKLAITVYLKGLKS